jgi:hypothetical protein
VRLFRAFVVVMTILLIGLARGCVFRPMTNHSGSHFNQEKNGIWLGIEWVNESHSEDEIRILANDFKQRQIVYVFAYVSYLRQNGDFGQTFGYAKDFLKTIKGANPDLKVLAWIGLPLAPGAHVDLSNTATRHKITGFAAHLAHDIGFDGIHLDAEYMGDGDPNVIALFDETRQAIDAKGTKVILSTVAQHIWLVLPEAQLGARFGAIFWSGDYLRLVARHVDQIAVMTYDSGMQTEFLYCQWMRFQVMNISRALENEQVELLFGVPTSEEYSTTHYPPAENITNGLPALIEGLNDLDARPGIVTGIAIYPHWETDSAEWKVYESLWLGK